MTVDEAVRWLASLGVEIGQMQYRGLWHYEQAITDIIELLSGDFPGIPCGEWEHLDGDEWRCFSCGRVVTADGGCDHPLGKYKHCPECGASMWGKEYETD